MKALKIIGIIVLVLIIAGGGYFFAVWRNSTSSNSSKTTATTTTKTTTSTGTPAAPATSTSDATPTTCTSSELTLTTAASNGSGAGTLAMSLVLTNSGKLTCLLGGFPGVSLVNDSGTQIGKPADRATGYSEKILTLKPGDTSTATITYTSEGLYNPGTCSDGATKFKVYPPNDVDYLTVAETTITAWCPSFETSPVQ